MYLIFRYSSSDGVTSRVKHDLYLNAEIIIQQQFLDHQNYSFLKHYTYFHTSFLSCKLIQVNTIAI